VKNQTKKHICLHKITQTSIIQEQKQ